MLILRQADKQDFTTLFHWRNHPSTRQFAHNKQPIALETHQSWFSQVLQNPQQHLLIIEQDQQSLGMIRIDEENEKGVVSIYLNPDKVSQGVGSQALIDVQQWIKTHCPQIKSLSASILPDNERSIKAFIKAGFMHKTLIMEKSLNG